VETSRKIKWAKRIGTWYFLLLGCLNVGMALFYSRTNWFGAAVLLISVLPLLVRYKTFRIFYGIFTSFIGVMMLVVCMMSHFSMTEEGTSFTEFYMGYLFILSFLAASLLMLYAAMADEDNRFRLV
jgi:hypothetical protein